MCANRQIMNIVARIEQIKSRSGVTLNRLLRQAGIGYGDICVGNVASSPATYR